MLVVKKVLFPTDFSRCADQALEHAVALAQRFGAELHVYHAVVMHQDDPHNPAHYLHDVAVVEGRMLERAAGAMAKLIQQASTDELRVEQVQDRALAAGPAIADYAKTQGVDLIVMGTHGHRGLRRLVLGSVAEEVVRYAPCPVLTVREQETPVTPAAWDNILVPMDFSDHARRSLEAALALAPEGGTLHLLHAVTPSHYPVIFDAGNLSLEAIDQRHEQASVASLEKIIASVEAAGRTLVPHAYTGPAAATIVEYAKAHGTALIVIATHGLTGLQHFLLGSVTEKVVRHAPCPVFTLKAFGRDLLG